jgi:hypothetical protein
MPKKKTEIPIKAPLLGITGVLDSKAPEPEIIITCITINPNGTIFGLANNIVYLYDDQSKTWKPY